MDLVFCEESNFYVKPGYVFANDLDSGAVGTVKLFNLDGNKAVKQMKLLQSTFREILLLKKCDHKNAIKFVDAWRYDNNVYLSMEAGDQSFFAYVEEGKIRSMDDLVKFANHLFSGLDYIHRRDMIHTDIKFGNMVIDKSLVLKLIDFDRATPFKNALNNSSLKENIRGTLEYEAPELPARINFNEKVDSWSVGVVLAECVLQTKNLFIFNSGEPQLTTLSRTLGTSLLSWKDFFGELELFSKDKEANQNFFHLLSSLIVIDPVKRLSMSEALNHPFVLKYVTEEPDYCKISKYDPAIEEKFCLHAQRTFDEELTKP